MSLSGKFLGQRWDYAVAGSVLEEEHCQPMKAPVSFLILCAPRAYSEESSMKRLKKCTLWSIAAVFMTISPAFSQISSTSLQGTITDPSGSAIAGATVVLNHPESKTERSAVTDSVGDYRFLAIPPGTYILAVTAKGFAGYTQIDLHL